MHLQFIERCDGESNVWGRASDGILELGTRLFPASERHIKFIIVCVTEYGNSCELRSQNDSLVQEPASKNSFFTGLSAGGLAYFLAEGKRRKGSKSKAV